MGKLQVAAAVVGGGAAAGACYLAVRARLQLRAARAIEAKLAAAMEGLDEPCEKEEYPEEEVGLAEEDQEPEERPASALKVWCGCMPYLEGRYALKGEWKGQPLWVMDGCDDEGIVHCIYSDGQRWKLSAHDEEDMAKGRCSFKAAEDHGDEAMPNEQVCGFLRPPIEDGETGLVNDPLIMVTPVDALSSVGPGFNIGARVRTGSAALLESVLEDCDVSVSEALSEISGQTGVVTRYHFTSYAALVVITTDAGKRLPPLPSMALVSL
eukprot:Rhum_TRINITY_DN15560_c0_g1::Rhum_TRINITY_DN15560_c0_g1_i1::g.161227::m.161227